MKIITKQDLLYSDNLGREYIVYTPDKKSAEYLLSFLDIDRAYTDIPSLIEQADAFDKVGFRIVNKTIVGYSPLGFYESNFDLPQYMLFKFSYNPVDKYKIGDWVRIRKDLVTSNYAGKSLLTIKMKPLAGRKVQIDRTDGNDYKVKGNLFWWAHEMFEKCVRINDELIPYSDNMIEGE